MIYTKKNICTREWCGGQYALQDYLPVSLTSWLGPVLLLADELTQGEGILRHLAVCTKTQRQRCLPCRLVNNQLIKHGIVPIAFRISFEIQCISCGYEPGGEAAAHKRADLYHQKLTSSIFCASGKHICTIQNTDQGSGSRWYRCLECRRERDERRRELQLPEDYQVLVPGNRHVVTQVG